MCGPVSTHRPEGFVSEGDADLLSNGKVEVSESVIRDGNYERNSSFVSLKIDKMIYLLIRDVNYFPFENISP